MNKLSRISGLLLFLSTLLLSCNAQTESQENEITKPRKPQKINGISFVAKRDPMNVEDVQPILDYNANYVAVHPYGFMRDLDNPEVRYNTDRQWYGERVNGTSQSITVFKEQGLQVMLKPQLWIGRGIYTGTIELETEEQWKLLETSYEAFILDFAQVAQDEKVAIFCIGTELESFAAARPQYWNALIEKIKSIYTGKLTYAGNWDSYKTVHFWDQLDFIGVDAYFPMCDYATPSRENIDASWNKWKQELSTLSRKHNKKILFTEYGYISADYAGREPWKNAGDDRAINEKAQQILLQGLYDNVWQEKWFAGGFLWKHHAETSRRGFAKRFTPQGKLAARTVTNAYKEITE